MLRYLSGINRRMDLLKEGIQYARNASEIFERLGNTAKQAECLINLASVLHDDEQLNTAEKAASRAIDLLPGKANNIRSAKVAVFLVIYITPRARQRRPFTITR